jgi:hypothetical protein
MIVWLSNEVSPVGVPLVAGSQEGRVGPSNPRSARHGFPTEHEDPTMKVMIGVDPHKGSHTATMLDRHERELRRIKVRAVATRSLSCWSGLTASGRGRGRSSRPVGWATCWPSSSSPPARRWSTCPRRWRHVCGCCFRLHALVGELVPGGIDREVAVNQARSLLEGIEPEDVASAERHRQAIELVRNRPSQRTDA